MQKFKMFLLTSKQLLATRAYYGKVGLDKILRRYYAGPSGSSPGAGAGRGGGAGGSIKEAGGGLGRYGTAQEEDYFYHKGRELLNRIKKSMKEMSSKETPKKNP